MNTEITPLDDAAAHIGMALDELAEARALIEQLGTAPLIAAHLERIQRARNLVTVAAAGVLDHARAVEVGQVPAPLTLADAAQLVWDDQAQGYTDMTMAEAVERARDTLTLPDAPAAPGAHPLSDDGTDLYRAYLAVLTAPQDALDAAVNGR